MRKGGREEGRKERWKEGREDGRKEEREGGKKEGRKSNRIGYILCRNSLLKHDIEGKVQGRIEVPRRRGRRSKRP